VNTGHALALGRQPGWPLALEYAIERARHKPFAWTGHNCATFAADCVAAITGVRVHEEFAAFMATERRAKAFGLALAPEVDRVLGADRRIDPKSAQRGDVLLLALSGYSVLGICAGISAAAVGPAGLAFVPMETAQCAWHI
jgi:hypothetical protein